MVNFSEGNIFDKQNINISTKKIIPLNMAEPILIVEGCENKVALKFAPHGAGRNMSRTYYKNNFEAAYPDDIDVRFYYGHPDESELPSAYKDASSIISSIKENQLTHIVDKVIPYGSIMAGDWEKDAPWHNKKKN